MHNFVRVAFCLILVIYLRSHVHLSIFRSERSRICENGSKNLVRAEAHRLPFDSSGVFALSHFAVTHRISFWIWNARFHTQFERYCYFYRGRRRLGIEGEDIIAGRK